MFGMRARLERWLRDLESADPEVSKTAAQELARKGGDEAAALVTERLQARIRETHYLDRDADLALVRTLRSIGGSRAVEGLAAALPYAPFREAVSPVLSEILLGLGESQYERARQALVEYLRARHDPAIVRVTVEALRLGGTEPAVRSLLAAANASPSLDAYDPALWGIVHLGQDAIAPLRAAMQAGWPEAWTAALALARLGDMQVAKPLLAELETAGSAPRPLEAAMVGLALLGDTRAVEPILGVLRSSDRRTDGEEFAQLGLSCLERLLDQHASEVDEGHLRAVLRLEDTLEFRHRDEDEWGGYATTQQDCSAVKGRARDELLRRGLSV